ncbi:hypothetical protein SDC9_110362 [bioreactor metagenome]|uniref:Uncharacterized protein n=1 Tax=bioreactor metagenome TaxID=1076179 RepID=A0A645BDS6_9ZZZZ
MLLLMHTIGQRKKQVLILLFRPELPYKTEEQAVWETLFVGMAIIWSLITGDTRHLAYGMRSYFKNLWLEIAMLLIRLRLSR